MKYFNLSEFACKCGHCGGGEEHMSLELLKRLDHAREVAGIPFVISSGFRCEVHNREVGGVPGSAHTKGLAVDIRCNTSQNRWKILKGLFAAGFERIELAPTWIHADVDITKPRPSAFYPS